MADYKKMYLTMFSAEELYISASEQDEEPESGGLAASAT